MTIVKSKAEDFINSARDSSNGDSGSFWCAAVNTSVLNLVQLMMISRLSGALEAADASWNENTHHNLIYKIVRKFPVALRAAIIVCSAVSIAAQTADLFLGFSISKNTRDIMSSIDPSAFGNTTVSVFVQVRVIFRCRVKR
jgi:hypothetical protein